MNEAVDPDSPIGVEARAWALAILGEDFPPERSAAFAAWLRADPRHRAAYEAAERTLVLLDEALAAPLAPRARHGGAWRWIGGAGAIAAGLAAAFVVTAPAPLTSPPGGTRVVALADGSQVTLAPASSLQPTWRFARRSYVLRSGEAFFEVAHDAAHPFRVQAGQAAIQVLGTRFDVNRIADDRVQVAVEQGLVEVSRPSEQGRRATRLVKAGQIALADRTGVRASPASTPIGAWRAGRLEYVAAPLGDVIADLGRYGVKARVAPDAAGLRLTAGLRVDQAGAFVTGLPRVLSVDVTTAPDGALLIRKRAEPRPTR